jgi:heme-degrading monooxygenase HmoA
MFARLTYIDILPEHHDELKKIFNEEVLPVVRKQKGNIGIWLLEPTDMLSTEYISLTEWISAEDAQSYDSSGTYKSLVDKLKSMYKSKPVLKTYNVAESKLVTTL